MNSVFVCFLRRALVPGLAATLVCCSLFNGHSNDECDDPGVSRCDGNTVVRCETRCAESGGSCGDTGYQNVETRFECGSDKMCSAQSSTASCVDIPVPCAHDYTCGGTGLCRGGVCVSFLPHEGFCGTDPALCGPTQACILYVYVPHDSGVDAAAPVPCPENYDPNIMTCDCEPAAR